MSEVIDLYGVDLFGASTKPAASGVVAERFGIPPFTILDAKQFEAGRKMAKTHQNVLVFCKGDWRAATQRIKQAEAA